VSVDLRKRLAGLESQVARRPKLTHDLARLSDAELLELSKLEVRVLEAPEGEAVLSESERRRRRDLFGPKCVYRERSPEIDALSDAEVLERTKHSIRASELRLETAPGAALAVDAEVTP
jgi:hypothetical protein